MILLKTLNHGYEFPPQASRDNGRRHVTTLGLWGPHSLPSGHTIDFMLSKRIVLERLHSFVLVHGGSKDIVKSELARKHIFHDVKGVLNVSAVGVSIQYMDMLESETNVSFGI